MKRVMPLLGMLLVLGGTAAAGWQAIRAADADPDPLLRKRDEADRVFYYSIDDRWSAHFPVPPGVGVVKLITHAVLPPGTPYDPSAQVAYAVRVRVLAGSRVLSDRVLHAVSRQSKADRRGDTWLHENAFVRDGSLALADDRVLLLTLPDDAGGPLDLEVLPATAPATSEVLVRAYAFAPRSRASRRQREQVLGDRERAALVERSTWVPWDLVPSGERLARLRLRYQRLSASGERDLDYQLRSVYDTGFRAPPGEAAGGQPDLIDAHRGQAIDVVGPATLAVELARTGSGDGATSASIADVSPGRPIAARVDLAAGAARTQAAVGVGPGLHSLRVTTTSPDQLALVITGAPESPLAASRYLADGRRSAVGDVRRFPVYLTGEADLPVVVAVPEASAAASRIVRIDTRLVAPDEGATAPSSVRVQADLVDESGAVVSHLTRAFAAPPAPFERLERADGTVLMVSEPVASRIIVPAGAARILLRADAPVALRLYAYAPTEWALQPPYADVALGDLRWRYAPLAARSWLPVHPENRAALERAGRRALLAGAARLVRPGEDEEGGGARGSQPTVALQPRGAPERQTILEPVSPDAYGDAVLAWRPGSLTRLSERRATRVVADARTTGRARIHYRAARAAVGQRLVIRVDGAVAARSRVAASRGRIRLPLLAAGEHAITVEGAPVEAWIDRPPGPGEPAAIAWLRTVYALDSLLTVPVRRHSGQATALDAVIYYPQPAAAPGVRLRAVIGGGRAARITGRPVTHITRLDRTVGLPAANRARPAELIDRPGLAGYPRVIAVPIGDDLAVGTHLIDLARVSGPRLWVRFFVTDRDAESGERVQEWTFEE